MAREILKVKDLGIDFGGLTAVNNFSLSISTGEIVGLIGPNGAGKTTVFNMLTKLNEPTRGTIYLSGTDLKKADAIKANKLGISRTFQNIRLFSNLSVADNVKVAYGNSVNYSLFDAIFHTPKYFAGEKELNEKVENLLKNFDLFEVKDMLACNLPYGQQRLLEIARAMASEPSLLLLDEPAAGMNPSETSSLMQRIKDIRNQYDISILLIEHDMNLVLGVCDRLVVLNFGTILASGKPEEVVNNREVIQAYLGD